MERSSRDAHSVRVKWDGQVAVEVRFLPGSGTKAERCRDDRAAGRHYSQLVEYKPAQSVSRKQENESDQ